MSAVKINPLNVLGIREMATPSPLFHYVILDTHIKNLEAVRSWIYSHLKYRFYIKETMLVDHDNQLVTKLKVGFEDPKESSFFLLSCSLLNT